MAGKPGRNSDKTAHHITSATDANDFLGLAQGLGGSLPAQTPAVCSLRSPQGISDLDEGLGPVRAYIPLAGSGFVLLNWVGLGVFIVRVVGLCSGV